MLAIIIAVVCLSVIGDLLSSNWALEGLKGHGYGKILQRPVSNKFSYLILLEQYSNKIVLPNISTVPLVYFFSHTITISYCVCVCASVSVCVNTNATINQTKNITHIIYTNLDLSTCKRIRVGLDSVKVYNCSPGNETTVAHLTDTKWFCTCKI